MGMKIPLKSSNHLIAAMLLQASAQLNPAVLQGPGASLLVIALTLRVFARQLFKLTGEVYLRASE